MKKDPFYRSFPVPGYILFIILFMAPVCMTLSQAFIIEGQFSVQSIVKTFADPYYQRIMAFTLVQAVASTFAALLLGLPGAYIMATYKFPGKRILRALYSIPFVLPSILVVLGFVIFYGNNGFLNQALMKWFHLSEPPIHILYSFAAVIVAHAFYNFPVVVSIVGEYWQKLDHTCEQAATTLGSKRGKVFRTITLPRLKPAIRSASSLVFLFCFTSFAIILVLGGGPSLTTTEVEIYRLARISMDINKACALCLFSLVVAIIALCIYSNSQKKQNKAEAIRISQWKNQRKPKSFAQHLGVFVYIVLSLLFILCPILSIVARSFMGSATRTGALAFTTSAYEKLFGSGLSNLNAVFNSIGIALISSAVSTMSALRISMSVAKSRRGNTFYDVLVMLPMATSSVIIGFSYFMISKYLTALPSMVLVVLAHSVITTPFIIRTILPVFRKIPQNLTNASRTMGYSARYTFKHIEKPILRPAMTTGFVFSFALSMGELNATLILGNTNTQTIPVQIYRLVSAYNYQGACALGCILISICFVMFLIGEAMKRKNYV